MPKLKTVLFSPTYSHLVYHKVTHVPITTSLVGSWLHILHFARQLILADALNHARTLGHGIMDVADWILEIDSDLPQRSTQKPLLVLESSFTLYPNAPSTLRNRFKNHGKASVQKKLKTRHVDNSCPPIYTYKKPHLPCEPLVVALACQGPWYEPNAPESWSWPQFSTSSLP